jgi:predicted TIM-barrel fold metal-dependent hydrolase
MPTRRDLIVGAGAVGAASAAGLPAAASAAGEARTAVRFDVPQGACDCHVHVFPDPARFPFWEGRVYTPPVATADDLLALQRALRLDRAVIVQPSVYGTDNRATLDGVRQLGPQRARAVAVIDERTTGTQLDEMHQAGVRGVRVNLETAGVVDPAASARKLQDAVRQVAGRGWHVQTYTRLSTIEALKDQLAAMPVPLVVDHFGGARGELGVQQPGFATLLDLVRSGKAYVKVSGAYRSSSRGPDFAEMAPFAQALIQANADRIVWGSDWPHPESSGRRPAQEISPAIEIDDGLLLNQLAAWAPDAAVRRKILVDNPARLYDFG